jgi:hypothetical protein
MIENMSQMDTGSLYVGKDELLENFSKVGKISEGKLSKPQNLAYDSGETDFSTYLYDSLNKRYKQVLIKRSGDWTIDNSATESEDAYYWLVKICLKQ